MCISFTRLYLTWAVDGAVFRCRFAVTDVATLNALIHHSVEICALAAVVVAYLQCSAAEYTENKPTVSKVNKVNRPFL